MLLELKQLAIERILFDRRKHVLWTQYGIAIELRMKTKNAVDLGDRNISFEITYQRKSAVLTQDSLRSVRLE